MKSFLRILFSLSILLSGNASASAKVQQLRVLGVIAGEGGGVALLKDHDGKAYAARTGMTVSERVTIEAIDRKHVTFRTPEGLVQVQVGDHLGKYGHAVAVAKAEQGFEVNGNTVKINRTFKQHVLDNELNKVLMQAAAVPYYQSGRLHGFRLVEIDPDSLYDKFGFKDGDVITQINGIALTDVSATIRLLTSLREAENVDLRFQRNGAEQNVMLVVQ